MIVKIFKTVWFFSLVATMATFLYVYASLPEDIVVREGKVSQLVSRNGFFYSMMALLAIFNALVFVISRLYADRSEYLRAWFYGLVIFLNMFFVVALQFVNLYNSQEKFNYGSIGYIIYGSIGLVVLWSFVWPIYFVVQRFLSKSNV